jgi:TFIIF-interacting CTD phosphatase-like protein
MDHIPFFYPTNIYIRSKDSYLTENAKTLARKLQIEANVLNQEMIHSYINQTVNFEIIYPDFGTKIQKI